MTTLQHSERHALSESPVGLLVDMAVLPSQHRPLDALVQRIRVLNYSAGNATAITLFVDLAANCTIESVDAPSGWTYSLSREGVLCYFPGTVAPEAATPEVAITLLMPDGEVAVMGQVSVSAASQSMSSLRT